MGPPVRRNHYEARSRHERAEPDRLGSWRQVAARRRDPAWVSPAGHDKITTSRLDWTGGVLSTLRLWRAYLGADRPIGWVRDRGISQCPKGGPRPLGGIRSRDRGPRGLAPPWTRKARHGLPQDKASNGYCATSPLFDSYGRHFAANFARQSRTPSGLLRRPLRPGTEYRLTHPAH
jgi:hypothetical protein